MTLVNKNGSLSAINFKCLTTGNSYQIIETRNDFKGSVFWKDKVWYCTDIVKRLSDGQKKSYTREEMQKRFKNIEV